MGRRNCRTDPVAVAGCQCRHGDSDCFDISGTGVPAHPFTADWKFHEAETNLASCGASGMMVDLPVIYRNPPRAKIHRNVPMTIPADGVPQLMEFNTPIWDTGGMFDEGSNAFRLTVPADGTYEIKFHVGMETDVRTPGFFRAEVWLNTNEGSICYDMVYSSGPPEYVRNGGFEDGMASWTTTGPAEDDSVAHQGAYSAAFTSLTVPNTIEQELENTGTSVAEGDILEISAWVRSVFADQFPIVLNLLYTPPAGGSAVLEIVRTDSEFVSQIGNEWQRISGTVTVPAFDPDDPVLLGIMVDGVLVGDNAWSVDTVSVLKIGPKQDMGGRLRDGTRVELDAGDYLNLMVTNHTAMERQALPNGGLDNVLEVCWIGPKSS